MEAIKDLNIPHIVGGVFPTAAPQVCIENGLINVIGIGEGESILPAFAEAVRLERDLDSIPGTWVKSQGAIRKTRGRRSWISKLLSLTSRCLIRPGLTDRWEEQSSEQFP